MTDENQYKHLGPRYGSSYRQYFVKGRNIRAETLFRETVGLEPRSPKEVAEDFEVPLEAVYEAIRYCQENRDVLDQDREEETRLIQARGGDRYPFAPPDYKPE
jgi:hypothetical protein